MLEAKHALSGLRWRPSQAVVLWLGRDGVLALRPDPYGPDALQRKASPPVHAAAATAKAALAGGAGAAIASAAHADFAAWCAAHPGLSCRVLLSAECLAVITVEPALGLKRRLELLAHARTQFEQYHGSDYLQTGASPWPLLPWRSASGAGATALRAPGLAILQAAARSHGVKLLSVQPAWAALTPLLLTQAQRAAGEPDETSRSGSERTLMLLDEGRVVTVIVCNGGRPERVALRRKPADPDLQATWQAALCAEWDIGTSASADPAAPAAGTLPVQVVHLPAAAQGLQGLAHLRPTAAEDFLDAGRTKRLPQLAAATALLVAAVAGIEAHGAWQHAQEAQTAMAAARRVPAPNRDPRDATTRQTEDRLQADLQRPWHAVFAAGEASTQAGMQWLLMDHTVGTPGSSGGGDAVPESQPAGEAARRAGRAETESRGELRLEAQALDLATAWRAAAALEAQAGVRQAVLTHVRSEAHGVRFELRAEWSDHEAAAAVSSATAPTTPVTATTAVTPVTPVTRP